jgi:hypothetical protein
MSMQIYTAFDHPHYRQYGLTLFGNRHGWVVMYRDVCGTKQQALFEIEEEAWRFYDEKLEQQQDISNRRGYMTHPLCTIKRVLQPTIPTN